jgi:hypothetical protein
VWLINHCALPPSEPGGTRHYALARELIRSGHDVTIIASSFNHANGNADELYARQTMHLREMPEF